MDHGPLDCPDFSFMYSGEGHGNDTKGSLGMSMVEMKQLSKRLEMMERSSSEYSSSSLCGNGASAVTMPHKYEYDYDESYEKNYEQSSDISQDQSYLLKYKESLEKKIIIAQTLQDEEEESMSADTGFKETLAA